MLFITDNLVKGSTIKLLIDSNGSNCVKYLSLSLFGKMVNAKSNFKSDSINNHTKRKPKAKAERFIKIPKNKQKEKNPTNLTKKANR